MTESYKQKLIALAKEIHALQLKESDLLPLGDKVAGVSLDTIRVVAKINYLIGYILALEE